jgi:hypothetical protein
MCSPAACKRCAKTTWTGCGLHVAQVRARVPADQWCEGHQDDLFPEPVGMLRRILGQRRPKGSR